jgi:hypothetical protein
MILSVMAVLLCLMSFLIMSLMLSVDMLTVILLSVVAPGKKLLISLNPRIVKSKFDYILRLCFQIAYTISIELYALGIYAGKLRS